MSSRDWFWLLAGALIMAAITALSRALLERKALSSKGSIQTFAVPVAAGLALIGVAFGIYFLLGATGSSASAHAQAQQAVPVVDASSGTPADQSPAPPSNAGSLDAVTQRLAARLASKGGSDSEWTLLAESYDYMGRTADARNARAHIASAPSTTASAAGTSGAPRP